MTVYAKSNFVAGFFSILNRYFFEKRQIGDFDPHLGEVGTTHDLRQWLVGRSFDFLLVIIELFSLAFTVAGGNLSMLSDRWPICPVRNVGVLLPNGWMDQDETPPQKGDTAAHTLLGPSCVVATRLDGSRCHLVRR